MHQSRVSSLLFCESSTSSSYFNWIFLSLCTKVEFWLFLIRESTTSSSQFQPSFIIAWYQSRVSSLLFVESSAFSSLCQPTPCTAWYHSRRALGAVARLNFNRVPLSFGKVGHSRVFFSNEPIYNAASSTENGNEWAENKEIKKHRQIPISFPSLSPLRVKPFLCTSLNVSNFQWKALIISFTATSSTVQLLKLKRTSKNIDL